MADGTEVSSPGELRALVEQLLGEVEALRDKVDDLRSGRPTSRAAGAEDAREPRALPTNRDPVEMATLAEWVDSLMVRYASAGDWLRPCWWRHGFVVEELAALRIAWLAAFDVDTPVDATAGVRWHEEAERCRERIRRTISAGPGCSAVSHRPDQPVTDDPRWASERAECRDLIAPTGSDTDRY